eukprot:TRINITY_DN50174_c0_g1_i1.p1 TRINITY_DN50174_c0_g1~~TRINITY_DN50174_c0_g1_i1.p1  ORF type:complete len:201 (-),score=33.84 TRINITY_DN50174_c0_g1_i1:265-867(-)
MGAHVGAALGYEFDVSDYALQELKTRFEGGDARLVYVKPEVFVTIEELELKQGGWIKVNTKELTMKDALFHCKVEVVGSKAGLASLLVMDRMQSLGRSFVGSSTPKAEVKARPSDANTERQTVKVSVSVDLRAAFGSDDVQVSVKEFKSSYAAFNWLLSVETARRFIEKAISEKASEAATKKYGEQQDVFQMLQSTIGWT